MTLWDQFNEDLESMIGKECWAITGGEGTGSVISLNIGGRYPRDRPLRNPHVSELVRHFTAEYNLIIYSPWRVESSDAVLCGSHHSNDIDGPYQATFEQVISHKLIDIQCASPSLDLKLLFERDISLSVFCALIGMDDDECYVFDSSSCWYSIGFDGKISKD